MESDVVRVCLIIGGALFAFGLFRLGTAVYKAEKKIKEVNVKEDKKDDN